MVSCCVVWCKCTQRSGCSLFRLPKAAEQRRKWIAFSRSVHKYYSVTGVRQLRRQKQKNYSRANGTLNECARMCSCHFKDGKKENGPTRPQVVPPIDLSKLKVQSFSVLSDHSCHQQLVATSTSSAVRHHCNSAVGARCRRDSGVGVDERVVISTSSENTHLTRPVDGDHVAQEIEVEEVISTLCNTSGSEHNGDAAVNGKCQSNLPCPGRQENIAGRANDLNIAIRGGADQDVHDTLAATSDRSDENSCANTVLCVERETSSQPGLLLPSPLSRSCCEFDRKLDKCLDECTQEILNKIDSFLGLRELEENRERLCGVQIDGDADDRSKWHRYLHQYDNEKECLQPTLTDTAGTNSVNYENREHMQGNLTECAWPVCEASDGYEMQNTVLSMMSTAEPGTMNARLPNSRSKAVMMGKIYQKILRGNTFVDLDQMRIRMGVPEGTWEHLLERVEGSSLEMERRSLTPSGMRPSVAASPVTPSKESRRTTKNKKPVHVDSEMKDVTVQLDAFRQGCCTWVDGPYDGT